MKNPNYSFKTLALFSSLLLCFISFQTKAQDLIGTYTIQRATNGVLTKNAGTVEIKQLVYKDTSVRVRMRKSEYNEIKYFNEWGQPVDFDSNDQIIQLSDGYHIVYINMPDNQYQYIEIKDNQVTKRIIEISGNGNGTYGNEVDISSPLTNFKNLNQVSEELSKGEHYGRSMYSEYLWSASLEPGVIVRKHVNSEHPVLYDICELLVKQGSVQEQNGWVMSQWLIDRTKSWEQHLADNAQHLLDMDWSDNLNVSKFNNGEIIPQAKTVAEWQAACKAKKPVWCYFKFNPANGAKFGKIYNYYTVIDKRGLAPKGYHIATESDFDLVKSLMETYENNGIQEYIFTDSFKEQLGGYFNGQIFDLAERDITAGMWWTSKIREVNSSVFNSSTGTYYTNKEILVYEFNQNQSVIALDTDEGPRTTTVKYQEFKKNWRITESKYSPMNEGYSVRCVKD